MNNSHKLLAEKYIQDVLPERKVVTEKFKSQEITPEQWAQWVGVDGGSEESDQEITEEETA